MGIAEQVYKLAPVYAQNILVSAYGWYWKRLRLSGRFDQERQEFVARESLTAEEWRHYQDQKLRELLLFAYEKVPYYRRTWRGLLTSRQLEKFTVADLSSLPVLEKGAIRDDPESFLAGGKPQPRHRVLHTSGSSGTPVRTYWLPEELQRALAIREARSCRFAGVSYSRPRATFSGRMVVPAPESSGPFHRFNWFEKQVYFSAFHLRPDTVEQYIAALRHHRPEWMTGYANSIFQMANLAVGQGLSLPSLRAVITTSEALTANMREVIERAFSTRVYEEYSTVENLFFVCENEHGQKLVSPDAGVLEVVDDQFCPTSPGNTGEVIATGFIRPSQPMIRYRIGDRAILSEDRPRCGRAMPVLAEVIGRVEDTVYGPDGRRMVRFHGIFVDQPNIQEGQVIQERLDLIRILVVARPAFGPTDEDEISSRIRERLGPKMKVVVQTVEKIPRNTSGKFKAVVSKLTQDEIASVQDI